MWDRSSVATHYKYIDGNNNTFVIEPSSIEYVPITKPQSSSGDYSGGAPKRAAITSAQFQRIATILDQIVADTANHIEKRNMGCGTVVRDGKSTYTQMKSPLKAELERELKGLVA